MNDPIAEIMAEVRRIADDVLRPSAEVADAGSIHDVVGGNVRLLASRRYFGLGVRREFGGFGADETVMGEFTELIASACGVTAFTQAQMHSGGGFAQSAQSESMRTDLLPKFVSGELLCGVAFSHLRRPGASVVTAVRERDGYRVNGVAPWVTGWSILDGFMLGAAVVDASTPIHLFFYVSKVGNESSLRAGPPISLHAMNASDTVEVAIDNLWIADSDVIGERPAEELKRMDHCGITQHVHLPLGCARGCIEYLNGLADRRSDERIYSVAGSLEQEVADCRHEAMSWRGACADLAEYKERALNARTWALELAVRAANAAITATGGAGQIMGNPPQRLMREAVFYTTLAQTADVRESMLARLIRKRST